MADRLTSMDASFLYMEDVSTVMHVGSVMVFDPPGGRVDHDRLLTLLAQRIAHLPRYRQRVRSVPGHLANPVWVDDEAFDLAYHVRRSALPKPGTDAQLEDFVARIQPRPLDRNRPLWEVYLVEGLEHGRFAIITKTHHALVDGINSLDLGHVLMSDTPGWEQPSLDLWRPQRGPSDLGLVTSALVDSIKGPRAMLGAVRGGTQEMLDLSGRMLSGLGSLASTVAKGAARPAPASPLNAHVGQARRFVMVGTDLAAYRDVRQRLARGPRADDVSVNDIVLASIAGALRAWLLTRGSAVHGGTVVRALVPVSVDNPTGQGTARLAACLVDLPVGEPAALMRLHQIAFLMRQQIAGGQAVGADRLAGLAGVAPPTLHSMGARLGSDLSKRLFNLIVTNVPGPQTPLYAGDARLLSTYPVIPLAKGQALAIGLTSYDGGVYYGLNADRDAMPDVEVLGQAIADSLAELADGGDTFG
ncbi:MAG: wax ester/triacylglycerol synthase family O-acyltransferase [Candidatus Phosphoribacter sp.]